MLPIVFVHGFLGFDYVSLGFARIYYFRRLKKVFVGQGVPVHFPILPPNGSVAQRAKALAEFLSDIQGEGLHLIGHSMGGLDSRYLIHKLDPRHRVRSLITIGTPHRGSPIARWMLDTRGPLQWVGRHWWKDALTELTSEGCDRFNNAIPDRADVRYESYAAVRPLQEMLPWFRPWTRLMNKLGEENDSQVPLSSARWGTFRGMVRADHLELVGWNIGFSSRQNQRPFDHVAFYRRIVGELAKETLNTPDFR